jgi:hypothetical protein
VWVYEQKGRLHGEGALVLTTASVKWVRIGGSSPAVSAFAAMDVAGAQTSTLPFPLAQPCRLPRSVSFSCGGACRSWAASATAEGEDGRGYERVGMDTPDAHRSWTGSLSAASIMWGGVNHGDERACDPLQERLRRRSKVRHRFAMVPSEDGPVLFGTAGPSVQVLASPTKG